jgi:hypothetical protein
MRMTFWMLDKSLFNIEDKCHLLLGCLARLAKRTVRCGPRFFEWQRTIVKCKDRTDMVLSVHKRGVRNLTFG